MRVITYVDGFNLYFGLRQARLRRYLWLDLVALSGAILKPNQQLARVHYFTARIRANGHNAGSMQRQSDYLDALGALPSLTIHEGHFLVKSARCRACGATWPTYEEKMSDVNLAVQLLLDAVDDRFDVAIIMSGDSDLATPVSTVRARFPHKSVVIAFPPKRNSVALQKVASGYFRIGQDKLRQSQLPNPVVVQGALLQRPLQWQ